MLEVDVELRRGDFQLACRLTSSERVTGLFGPSGAGKSTLLRILAGLERPDAGTVRIAGRRVFDANQKINVPAHRRRLGVVFQAAHLFPHMNVRHNLNYGARFAGTRDSAAFKQTVEMLDIGPLLERRVGGLSGGERQRVAIGRALLADPAMLLLDEPLASLDAARKREVLPYIERLSAHSELPIVFVTHQPDELLRLARHHVAVVDDGRIVFSGATSEFLTRPDLLGADNAADVGALLDTEVRTHYPSEGLTRLDCAGQPLYVPLVDQPPGTETLVHVRGRDVILARSRPTEISALNCLAGTIEHVDTDQDGFGARVFLTIGSQRLEARITRYSLNRLALTPGDAIYAVIKSLTLAEQAWQPVAQL